MPGGLRPLVTAALDKDPGRRPDAAGALRALVGPGQDEADAVTGLLPAMLGATWVVGQHTDTTAWTSGPVRQRPGPRRGRRRGRALMMTLTAVTALVTVAAGGWFFGSQRAPDEAGGGAGEARQDAERASSEPVPVPGAPDTDLGGVNLLDGNHDNDAGTVGLVESRRNSIQLYGVEDPALAPRTSPN